MGQKNKQILTNLGTMNSLNFVSTILKQTNKQKKTQKHLYVTLSLVVDDWICYSYNSENPNS